jgi:hypothetical protein
MVYSHAHRVAYGVVMPGCCNIAVSGTSKILAARSPLKSRAHVVLDLIVIFVYPNFLIASFAYASLLPAVLKAGPGWSGPSLAHVAVCG